MHVRLWFVVMLVLVSSCSFGRPAQPAKTATPSTVPSASPNVTQTSIASSPTPIPATDTPVPDVRPLKIRIIAPDTSTYTQMVEIIGTSAMNSDIDVDVDVRSPDGALALQQGVLPDDRVDVWIANSYDLWQLVQINAVSRRSIASDVPMYASLEQRKAFHDMYGIAPIALNNYFIGIYNTDILTQAPTSLTQLQNMPGLVIRPRYRVAHAWAEGRWFDAMMNQFDATSVLTNGIQAIDTESTIAAMQTLVDLRALGPRDVTSYAESTTDFYNSRVPFTLDGDAALRRYNVISDSLILDYTLPPLIESTDSSWLPAVDVVYAIIPENVQDERREQAVELIRSLRTRDVQQAIFQSMRMIPVRNDVLSQLTDDRLATVLHEVAQQADVQWYDDATVCRWDAYEQVLPFALLKIWRVPVAVESLAELVAACPPVSTAP
ncbi:MAG: extracellular solute-binding protein [Chloroflexi bacterium]|nr:extracellular solute-binding protein [Chloroflexota bacterium]